MGGHTQVSTRGRQPVEVFNLVGSGGGEARE